MRALLAVLAATLGALLFAGTAAAHPLGNFTINHYSRVQPSGDRIYVLYVLDMAEIPTFRERQTMGSPRAYAEETARKVAREVEVAVDGRGLRLTPVRHALAFPPGVGGLRTLRFELVLRTRRLGRPGRPRTLTFDDRTYAGRIGWKEVVVAAAGDARVLSSTVPARSSSGELLAYPKNLLQSPLDVTSATARFAPGARAGPVPRIVSRTALTARVTVRTPPDSGFASLIAERHPSLGFVLLSLLVAAFWGAAHAFSPGHGKAIVAGYLVGTRGRIRDALALALVVTVTHTSGVFALGGITLVLSAFVVPEQLYPWLNLASALLVVCVGVGIVRWRVRTWRRGRPDYAPDHVEAHAADPGHDHRQATGHGREHAHPHDHDHAHGAAGRGLLGIGISAGILPCPTALVVLLAAISLHRVTYGLVLILAFSAGLALSVASIGLVAVLARRTFNRVSLDGPIVRALPAASALVVICLGLAMTVRAVSGVL